jgi:hypothetical protein
MSGWAIKPRPVEPLISSWTISVWWLGWERAFKPYRWGYGYRLTIQGEFCVWLGPVLVRFPRIQKGRRFW